MDNIKVVRVTGASSGSAEALAQFETNFFGTHRVCRAVLPHLRAQRAGMIINMSSLAGRIAPPFQGFYSATEFAIEAYRSAARGGSLLRHSRFDDRTRRLRDLVYR